jgi:RHS repeat-associated protein
MTSAQDQSSTASRRPFGKCARPTKRAAWQARLSVALLAIFLLSDAAPGGPEPKCDSDEYCPCSSCNLQTYQCNPIDCPDVSYLCLCGTCDTREGCIAVPCGLDCDADGLPNDCDANPGARLYVNASVSGGRHDGSSWANAYNNLQDALNAARPCWYRVSEIWVAAGTYRPDQATGNRSASFQLVSGVKVYGGFAGGETALSERRPEQNATILSGEIGAEGVADNSYHVVSGQVVYGEYLSNSTRLDGFHIVGGNANGASPHDAGGGFYNTGGAPLVVRCVFEGNSASSGGAVANTGSGNLTLVNCQFSQNSAVASAGAGGGALLNGSGATSSATNCLFWDNSATAGARGGAASNSGNLTLTNCTLVGNVISDGLAAGGALRAGGSPASLTVLNSIVWGNDGTDGPGTADQINATDLNRVTVRFSCIQNGWTGDGNISSDPLFSVSAGPPSVSLSLPSPCLGTASALNLPNDVADLDGDADVSEPTPQDLLENPRTTSSGLDMGALQWFPTDCPDPTDCSPSNYRCCGSVCCNGECCDKFCSQNQCVGEPLCPAGACSGESYCCADGTHCCPDGHVCCGQSCCPDGEACCDGQCVALQGNGSATASDARGTEFIVTFLRNTWFFNSVSDGKLPLQAELYVGSDVCTNVRVRYPMNSPTLDTTVAVAPGHMTVIPLPVSATTAWRPTEPPPTDPPPPDWEPATNAVLVTADHEIVCYMMDRMHYASDGAQALPVDAWNTEYIISTWPISAKNVFTVVAAYNGTTVTIEPTAWLAPRDDLPDSSDQLSALKVPLDRGEAFVGMAAFDSRDWDSNNTLLYDLTGTIIRSNRPVGVVQGTLAAVVPTYAGDPPTCCADLIFEAAPPVEAWGTTAVVTRLPGQTYYYVRVLAAEDGTSLYVDGELAGTFGRTDVWTLFALSDNHVISANKPVQVTQYMASCAAAGGTPNACKSQESDSPELSSLADPSMGSVLPTDQYPTESCFLISNETVPEGRCETCSHDGPQFVHQSATIVAHDTETGSGIQTVHLRRARPGQVPDQEDFALEFVTVGSSSFAVASLDDLPEGMYTVRSNYGHMVLVAGRAAWDSYLYTAEAMSSVINPHGDEILPTCSCQHDGEGWDCAASDSQSEDADPKNGTLDEGEDTLVENGRLDVDRGLRSIELAPGTQNLTLNLLAPVIPGDSSATFTVLVTEPSQAWSGGVIVTDLHGNTTSCVLEVPLTAAFEFRPCTEVPVLDCDPNATIDTVQECHVVLLDGYPTFQLGDPDDLTLFWDWTDPGDSGAFIPPDATGVAIPYVWRSDTPAVQTTEYAVALRVIDNATETTATVTKTITVVDTAPSTPSIVGPRTVAVGQRACYSAGASSPCDALDRFDWSFGQIPTDPFDLEVSGEQQCHTWTAPGTKYVRVQAVDSDGSASLGYVEVAVTAANPPYQERAVRLEVQTRYHACDPLETAGLVRHRAEMRVVNTGEVDARGPVFVAFENLLPAGATVVGGLTGDGIGIAAPHLMFLPDGSRLAPDEATEWAAGTVEWDVPTSSTEAFAFDAVAYAPQRPPGFTEYPETVATEGAPYHSRIVAVDVEGDPVYYELATTSTVPAAAADPPAGMFLDALTGVLSWTPSQTAAVEGPAADGHYPIMIVARDGFVGSYSAHSFDLTVEPVNVAPVIESEPETVALVQVPPEPYEFDLVAYDADGDALSLAVGSSPSSGITFGVPTASDGRTTWRVHWDAPTDTYPYVYVTLTVTDDDLTDPKQTVREYWLIVTACAERPQIVPIPDDAEQAAEGLPYVKLVQATPPGLYYFLDRAPEGMAIDHTSGLITWTPSYRDHGRRLVHVVVSTDPEGLDDCFSTETFWIDVEDRNAAPVFTSTGPANATEGVEYTYQAQADDADGDALRYLLVSGPEGMTVHPTTGLVRWTPSQTAVRDTPPGGYTFALQVRDPQGEIDVQEVALAVDQVNVPPHFESYPGRYAVEGQSYTYRVVVRDPDEEPPMLMCLDWLWPTIPCPQLVGDPEHADVWTAVFEWTPAAGASYNSPYPVKFKAIDGASLRLEVTQEYEINVLAPPVYGRHAPVIGSNVEPPPFARVGTEYSVLVSASDEDEGDEWHYTSLVEPALPLGTTFTILDNPTDANHGLLTWTPVAGEVRPDPYFVSVWVTDTAGLWSYIGFWVMVLPAPLDPAPPSILIDPAPEPTATVGEPYTVNFEVADPNGDALAFDVVAVLASCDNPGPLTALPTGLTWNQVAANSPKGRITWTPTRDQIGTHWIRVRVWETKLTAPLSADRCFAVTVSGSGSNSAPEILEPIPCNIAVVGSEFNCTIRCVNPPDDADWHVFSLWTAPSGMTIEPGPESDPGTGVLRWTPQPGQLGRHTLTVRVTDSERLFDEAELNVHVYAGPSTNQAPTITSTPVLTAQVDQPYTYTLAASDLPDANCTSCTFTLEDRAAAGMVLTNGAITWQPTAGDIGTYPVRWRVTDAAGAYAEQSYALVVSASGTNQAPTIIAPFPPETAKFNTAYAADIMAADPENNSLSFVLVRGPVGMLITTAGHITWTPAAAQVGCQAFRVRVSDGAGGVAEREFVVTVSQDGQNHAPRFVSQPVLRACNGAGCTYTYDVVIVDDDPNDDLWLTLVAAPAGMTFASSGASQIVWNTASITGGSYHVVLRARDAHAAAVDQVFDITVSSGGTNRPPRIVSTPVTVAAPGPYSYQAEALDDPGSTLSWSVSPSSFLVSENGLVTGSPAAGSYAVTLRVEDQLEAFDEQPYTLVVSPYGQNGSAPVFTTSPITRVVLDRAYSYAVQAYDPDGPSVSWESVSGPSGMTLEQPLQVGDPATVAWSSAGPIGEYDVVVTVKDSQGAAATQTYQLEVVANRSPVITSTPPGYAVAGLTYTYHIQVEDPDDDAGALVYTIVELPTGTNITADGVFTWTPAPEDNERTFTVEVKDSSDASDTQTFTVAVRKPADDVGPPNVWVQLTQEGWSAPEQPMEKAALTIGIYAVDDLGIANGEATYTITPPTGSAAGPTAVALNADGYGEATYTPTADGRYVVTVSATDIAGNTTTVTTGFYTLKTAATPRGKITEPAPDDVTNGGAGREKKPLEALTTIRGWAAVQGGAGADFYMYSLAYRAVGSEEWTTFKTAYAPVGHEFDPGVLGEIDPTLMVNGLYDVRLLVENTAGTVTEWVETYLIAGDTKVGNFTVSFADLEVPVAGIPITITRTYDSRIKSTGEFGVGWKLELASLKLQENGPMGEGWPEEPCGTWDMECCIGADASHAISLTWPDGREEVFEMHATALRSGYSPTAGCQPVNVQRVEFERTSRGTSTLALLGPAPLYWVPGYAALAWDQGGGEDDPPYLWTPQGYVLTTADQMKYTFQRAASAHPQQPSTLIRLVRIEDPNGNTLTFDDNGITHSAGDVKIDFVRGGTGRIMKIVDPAGGQIRYEYDLRGDLTRVIDRTNNGTTYRYNAHHDLVDIIDARGVKVARNFYDDAGRLIAYEDAEGHRYTFDHILDTRIEVVQDRLGHPTEYGYDAKGNITTQTQHVGGQNIVTSYAYDDQGNRTWTKDALNRESTEVYDAHNNLTHSTDFDGNETAYAYDTANRVTRIEDPLGHLTLYEYDTSGNATKQIRRAAGGGAEQVTLYTYDARGNRLTEEDPLHTVTRSFYDDAGNLTRTEDARGHATEYYYDANGNRTRETRTRTVGDSPVLETVTQLEYDADGRLTRSYDPSGVATITTYNALGKQEQVTTPSGSTHYEYDLRGALTRVVYADDSSEQYEYDKEGRRTQTIDRDGRETRYAYDELGRLTTTVAVGPTTSTSTSTQYDALGRVTRQIDQLNHATGYAYGTDPSGLRTQTVTDAKNNTTHYTYDRGGNVVTLKDARQKETHYTYDHNGQQTQVTFPGGSTRRYAYDAAGRKTAETDQAAKTTQYRYDAAGQLTGVVDPLNDETVYAYDEAGNRTRQTDAEGRTTLMEYDASGRLTKRILPLDQSETFAYDAAGNLTRHSDFAATDKLDDAQATFLEYDSNNRLTRKAVPQARFRAIAGDAGSGGTFDFSLPRWANDASTCTLTVNYTLPAGGPDIVIEDSPNDPVPLHRSGTANTTGTFDWTINVGGDEYHALFSGKLHIALRTSDSPVTEVRGRLLGVSPVTTYTYTPGGLRTEAGPPGLDELLGRQRFYYDERGRLTKVVKPNNDRLEYDYTDTGNRRRLTVTPAGKTGTLTGFVFDELNRPEKVWEGEQYPDVTTYTSYGYDAVGNRTLVRYPNGTETVYTYDDLNRLTHVVNRKTAEPKPILSQYRYLLGPAGNRIQVLENEHEPLAQRRTVTYDYDDVYRLTREVVRDGNGILDWSIAYAYDKVGNRTRMTETNGVAQRVTAYEYDANDRLTRQVSDGPPLEYGGGSADAGGRPRPWRYAGHALGMFACVSVGALLWPLGLLRTRRPGEGVAVRRRRAFIRAVALALVPLMGVGPEAVAGLQQEALLAQALAAAGLAQAATYEITYTYDANGNLVERTQDDRTDTYVYDAENRLIAADTQAGAVTTPVAYTYDPDGIRQSKSADGSTTLYLTDANRDYAQVLEEWDSEQHAKSNGAPTVRYTYGDDLISQTRGPGRASPQTSFYHYDGQLSTRLLTNGTPGSESFGQVTDTYRYDAFGNLKTPPGPTPNDYLYTGEQYDANVGFYYLRARYYDQGTGRFASRDTYDGRPGDPSTLHKYLYASGNPIGSVDPTGHYSFSLGGVLGAAAISGLISGILTGIYGYAKGWAVGKIATFSAVSAGMAFLMTLGFFGMAYAFVAGGASAATGFTAAGLIITPTTLGLAVGQWQDAMRRGDAVDKAFATIDLALAVYGTYRVAAATRTLPIREDALAAATAERLAALREGRRRGTASVLLNNGDIFGGRSKQAGGFDTPLHPDVKAVLERLRQTCGEPRSLSGLLDSGQTPQGAWSMAVELASGKPMTACESCQHLFKTFGVNDAARLDYQVAIFLVGSMFPNADTP